MQIVYRTRWLAIRAIAIGVLYHTRSRKPARVNAKIPPSDRPSVRPSARSVRPFVGGRRRRGLDSERPASRQAAGGRTEAGEEGEGGRERGLIPTV